MAIGEYLNWEEVDTTKKKAKSFNGRVPMLWLKSGSSYTVRPIHKVVRFYKYFNKKDGKMRTAITADRDNCAVKNAHPELKYASERYGAYVIDRSDNQLKIMEFGTNVLTPIKMWTDISGKNPGGPDGHDITIRVSGVGLQTEYKVDFAKVSSPLTEEELDVFKKELDGDKEKLGKIFASHSAEEIEKRLFGEIENNKPTENNDSETSTDASDESGIDW